MAEAVAAQPPVTQGLATFQLKPPGLSGSALFAHMVEFRARHSSQGKPSPFLDAEITQEQEGILAPTIHDLSVSAILKDAGGEGATKKLAQRKLSNLAGAGEVRRGLYLIQCGIFVLFILAIVFLWRLNVSFQKSENDHLA